MQTAMCAQLLEISLAMEKCNRLADHFVQKHCLPFIGRWSRPTRDLLVALRGSICCGLINNQKHTNAVIAKGDQTFLPGPKQNTTIKITSPNSAVKANITKSNISLLFQISLNFLIFVVLCACVLAHNVLVVCPFLSLYFCVKLEWWTKTKEDGMLLIWET